MHLYTTLWNINVRKTNNSSKRVFSTILVNEKKTLHTNIAVNDLYAARLCYTRLSGYLVCSKMFVSGLPGLVPDHPQRSCLLQYARASVCRSCAFDRCFLFPNIFSVKCSVIRFSSFSPKIPSLSSVNRIFWTGVSSSSRPYLRC